MEAALHLKPGLFPLPETFNLEKISKAGQIFHLVKDVETIL